MILAVAALIVAYLYFHLWAVETALNRILTRLVKSEIETKCAEEINKQGLEFDTAEWLKKSKRFEYQIGGHYGVRLWDVSNPLWLADRVDVVVYVDPSYDDLDDPSIMTDATCRYNVTSGYAST